jgi:hypothetical protein
MNTNPQIYHGEWWLPAVADHDTRMVFPKPEQMMGHEKKYTGTLTYYGDGDTTLELYRIPSDFRSSYYHQNEVMWGKDANGNVFTLFNVSLAEQPMGDFTCTKFVVSIILKGEHVLTVNDELWKKCVVRFDHLNNWLFNETKKYINFIKDNNTFHLDAARGNKIQLDATIEDGLHWKLGSCITILEDLGEISFNQNTFLEVEASKPISFTTITKHIGEFEQFLSIALYCYQSFESIQLLSNEDEQDCELLIKKERSVDPSVFSLVKFDLFKDKLPSMLKKWHKSFDRIAPISSYLIDSLQKKSRFDVPDFLIIAQALDGYHKRFVNKKDGRDIRQFEMQIEILLNKFKSVKAIKACKINPVVLKDSRHKYSHLYPDEEETQAVKGDDLYWLTEKCKILLTCCILNMLGLTNKDINLCCENSPISQIIDSLPLEI